MRIGREAITAEGIVIYQRKTYQDCLSRLDKALPYNHIVCQYNTMIREETRILVQLRTNHVGLNSYLHKMHGADLPRCECGAEQETVALFLFLCPQLRVQRVPIKQTLGSRWTDLPYTLGAWSGRRDGATGKLVDGPRKQWKPNRAVLKAVIQFVKATQRLQPKAVAVEEAAEEIVEESGERRAVSRGG